MKKSKKILAFLLTVVMVISVFHVDTYAGTKEKKIWYCTVMNGDRTGIKKMKLKGNKLIIWGSFGKGASSEESIEAFYGGEKTTYKKRVFLLSEDIKFYATGGTEKPGCYSKAQFRDCYVTQPGLGLGFRMLQKNGKIVKIYTDS